MVSEQDDLDLIPRSVRDKLDRVGRKLHLRHWECLSLPERRQLRDQPCESPAEISRYRADLIEMVQRRTGTTPQPLEPV